MYGNEDADTDTQDLTKTDFDEPESPTAPGAKSTPPKPVEKAVAPHKPLTAPAPVGAPIQSYTTPLPSDPSPYAQQGTQQIPTYQQPSNYEAKDAALSNEDGFGGERTVRPSEMKDEG